MKTLERLPAQCGWRTKQNRMLLWCGYTPGKIGINGASTIFVHVSLVIHNWFCCSHALLKYWPPLLAKIISTHFLPHRENECQRRVDDHWSCVLGNHTPDSLQSVNKWIIIRLYKQNRGGYPACPISIMSVNGVGTMIGPVSCVIRGATGCRQS